MNIRDAIRAIVATQAAMEITAPKQVKVAKAWNYQPPQMETLVAALPAWTNSWDLVREEGSNAATRRRYYTVHMQLHVAQATNGDDSLAADIATAFMEVVHTAFGSRNAAGEGGVTLYGDVAGVQQPTVSLHGFPRGGSPTLALLGDGPVRTIGLDLFLDISIADGGPAGGYS